MWRGLVVMVSLVGLACAASLGLPNELYNGGFELGTLEGWRVEGNVYAATDYQGIIPYEGYWMAVWVPYDSLEGSLQQEIAPEVTGVPYEIDLSGWIGVIGDAWAEVVVTIDGEPVASSGPIYPYEYWQYFEIRVEATPECYKDVHIYFHTAGVYDGYENNSIPFAVVLVDGLDLEERIVPEPSTIALLLSGLAGIAGVALKRR